MLKVVRANPAYTLDLLADIRLQNLITNPFDMLELIICCPDVVTCFPEAITSLMQLSTLLYKVEDVAKLLMALTVTDSQTTLGLFQTYIAPCDELTSPEIYEECLAILSHLHRNPMSLAKFTFGTFIIDFIAVCRHYLAPQTINYYLCDAIVALLKAFAGVKVEQQRIIADDLYLIQLLYGESKPVAILLYQVKPTLESIDKHRMIGRQFEELCSENATITDEVKIALQNWQAEREIFLKPWEMKSLLRCIYDEFRVQLKGDDLKTLGFYISAPTVIPKTLFLHRSRDIPLANTDSDDIQVHQLRL